MTQQVFSNDMVAHVWAQQRQSEGRSGNGNFYFRGRSIYSYGAHFVAGYIAAPGVAFVTTDGYSITTTSKHMPPVRAAVRHYARTFYVPNLTNLQSTLDSISRHRADPRKGDALKRLRAEIEREVAPLVTNYADAAAWMLGEVGLPASRVDVIARKVKRAADNKAAADEREAVATWRGDARLYGTLSTSAFASEINSYRFAENTYAGASNLDALVHRLTRAHKQAARDGHTARKAILWTRLKRARAARAEISQERGTYVNNGALPRTVRAIASLRHFFVITARGDIPGPRAFESARSHIGTILETAHPSPATRERLATLAARFADCATALRVEIERERFAAEAETRAAWRRGDNVYARNLSDEQGGALLRARGAEISACRVISGDLETSHGARVPLRHAAAVFAYVRRIKESAASQGVCDASTVWRAGDAGRTLRVGHFRVDEINARGDFVAGCHRIYWPEIERLARELGLWDCDAESLRSADVEQETDAA